MSVLVAVAAAAAVLLAAGPPRAAARGRSRESAPMPSPATVLGRLGGPLRRGFGRRPDPVGDRRAGAAAVVLVAAILLGPVPAATGTAAALLGARALRLRRGRSHRGRAVVQRDLPDLVDLLALAVGAGVAVPAAIPVVARSAPEALQGDLRAAADALAGGRSSDEVVTDLGCRWGAPGRPLVHALVDHLRYGTPVLPALERVAAETRAARRRAAEVRARRLPVLLLLPLVLCTLPAFGLLTVAPLVAGTFDSLRGGHLEAPASVAPQ